LKILSLKTQMAEVKEAFLKHFYDEYNKINELLQTLNKDEASNLNEQEKKLNLSNKYESISTQTEILQKYFTENTAFIPIYEVRKAQEHLAKLNRLAQEKRDQLFPKKKFGFKSKQNMTTLEAAIKNSDEVTSKQAQASLSTPEIDNSNINVDSSCSIKDIDNQEYISYEEKINGKDIAIVNVKNSTIQLHGNPSVLWIKDLENTLVLCGPITGSAFVNNCKNCKIIVACHQLRIHESHNTQFYINVGSRAIIENCKNVQFSEYSFSYPNIEKHFEMSGLSIKKSNWECVDDFNWLNQEQKSPNWKFLDNSEKLKWASSQSGQLSSSKFEVI
jgi:tubulin-specific chaperone C